MSLSSFDDPWAAEHWVCQDCGAALSEEKDGPGARWCSTCRTPGAVVLPPEPPTCDGCEQIAERRILTSKGLLCQACGDRFVEVQRFRVLEAAKREAQRFRKRRELAAMAREEE